MIDAVSVLGFTVNVAAVDVAVAGTQVFVNTARYWLPLRETVGAVINSVLVVTPLYGAVFERFVNGPPVLICHCTLGAGVPLAAAVKLALAAP